MILHRIIDTYTSSYVSDVRAIKIIIGVKLIFFKFTRVSTRISRYLPQNKSFSEYNNSGTVLSITYTYKYEF